MLGRPYMLELLHAFESGRGKSIRFRDLERTLRIPPKTLSERLRVLVERGFLVRRAYRELPPRVEYEPTAKTANLRELFTVLARWAAENSLTATASVSTIGPTGPPPLRPRRARG